MKKLLIIAVLFCLSALSFNVKAQELTKIKDKDFEKIFTNFQKEIKGGIDNWWNLNYYFDEDAFECSSPFSVDVSAIICFILQINNDWKQVANLSSKNKYCSSIRKNYKKNNYSVFTWSLDFYDSEYHLHYLSKYYEDGECDGEGSLGCTFKKVNGEWNIVNISQAG